jgi:FkbM family methyltransferase
MAREIALIRTHFFNPRIKNAIQFLAGHFGEDVYVVCPDRVIEKLNPGVTGGFSRFIPLREAVLDDMGLPRPEKWEWICGDYALYRARMDCPWADRIWLIEYDIVFNFDRASDFFGKFQDDDADLLAFEYQEADPAWPWRKLMLPLSDSVMRCFFSPIRLSGRALDHLLEQRRALARTVAADAWPNDESFVATTLTHDGFRCRDITDGVMTAESFSWSRPHSIREVKAKGPDGLVYHPVVAGDAYWKKARQFLQRYPERLPEIAATLKEECGDDRYEMMRDLTKRRAVAQSDPGTVESIAVRIVSAAIDGRMVRFAVENETDIIQSHHAAGRFYEWEEMSIIREHFPAGGVFCDIGSNVGNHLVFAGLFLGASRIVAFEPNPDALRLLRLNILLNGLSGIVDLDHAGYGLGSAPGYASMAAPERNLGGNTLDIDDPSGTVEIRTGDSCLAGMAVDFLKIDVEGMEIAVLDGLAETIGRCRPPIFIEVWDDAADALQRWCAANRYEVADTYRRYAKCKNFMLVPSRAG